MNNPSDTINDLRNAVTQYEREHGTLSIEPSIHTTANCEDCSGSCSDSCTEASGPIAIVRASILAVERRGIELQLKLPTPRFPVLLGLVDCQVLPALAL